MKRHAFFGAVLSGVMLAATAIPAQAPAQTSGSQPIYGSQMMTDRERMVYRERMRSAGTEEERARIRSEHHERMQERAAERGMTLPAEPPARGMGQGMGHDMQKGMGQGNGPKRQRMDEQIRERKGMGQ